MPDIDRIMKLTPLQEVVIFIVIIALIAGLDWQFYYKVNKEDLNSKNNEITQLRQKLEEVKIVKPKFLKLKEKVKELEEDLLIAKEKLPKKSEIPKLLTSITRIGREAGLDFKLFKPISERKKGFYAEIPVQIEVFGGYHDVAVFCDKVGKLSRIVNIFDLTMKGLKEVKGVVNLNVKCNVSTFKFVEDKGKKKKRKK
jgi:type IV pilus assembly protein PilO